MTITLADFLRYLITGGAGILAAMAASWAASHWGVWQRWESETGKRFVTVAVALGLGLGAWAIANYATAEVLEKLQPAFTVAVLTLGSLLGSQWWNERVNKAGDPPTPAVVALDRHTGEIELLESKPTRKAAIRPIGKAARK